jgi:8-oxo-dGTP pyrophosphatase MutT (NUDIX family)
MGKKPKIRAIAICVFRHGNRILVHEDMDSVKRSVFARPLGGGIDFGETSKEAIVREIQEELGAEMTDARLLGIVENLFELEGKPGHEIVFVYDGRFVDESLYAQAHLEGIEGKHRFKAVWRSLEELRAGTTQLVPPELWNLLEASAQP